MKENKFSIWRIISLILYALVIIFALFALSSKLAFPGNFKLLTVMSGSMEPTIRMGSLVAIKPANEYKQNDIITFYNPSDSKKTITHRLVEIKIESDTTYYTTQGDANGSPDAEQIYQNLILGKVRFNIPYLGYPVGFARTPAGLIIFIIIPATIIIYDEILKIKEEIKKKKRRFKKVEVK